MNRKFTKTHWLGVYPADQLPHRVSLPCAVVVNMDSSNKSGSHWIAIYIDKQGVGEFFCSFGLPPTISHHLKFLKNNSRYWMYNSTKLQCFSSSVCGHYCLLYLHDKMCGISLKHFLLRFSNDCFKNDKLMKKFRTKKC